MKLRDNHHIVLTTPDIDRCLRFYHDVLSMEAHEKDGQICLYFGSCEITLKEGLTDFAPSAVRMGIINLCLSRTIRWKTCSASWKNAMHRL